MEEIWKEIKGYEGLYEISNLGRVKSLKRVVDRGRQGKRVEPERILKPSKNGKGYLCVKLCFMARESNQRIHSLVASHFPNIKYDHPAFQIAPELKTNFDYQVITSQKFQVNHINGIKTDNRWDNLEWVTNSENQIHAYKLGLNKKRLGKDNHATKLTAYEAALIKYGHPDLSQRQIAKIYGITQAAVSLIKKGVNWGHI
jgi:hypothetical protein